MNLNFSKKKNWADEIYSVANLKKIAVSECKTRLHNLITNDELFLNNFIFFLVPGFPGSSSTEDGTSSDSGVFPDFNDSSVNEEMRKMFENFGKMDFNSDNE